MYSCAQKEKKGKKGQVRLEVRCKVRGKKGLHVTLPSYVHSAHNTQQKQAFYFTIADCYEGGYKLLDVKEGDGDNEGQRLCTERVDVILASCCQSSWCVCVSRALSSFHIFFVEHTQRERVDACNCRIFFHALSPRFERVVPKM